MAKTAWGKAFTKDLKKQLGRDKVVTMRGHDTRHRGWPGGAPRGVMLHWTAGAATASTDPDHPGNKRGANSGVVSWCHQPSARMPYCNITLDRDGTCYLNTVHGSAWHSGEGSFAGTQYARLGIGANSAHLYTLGIEIVDKGTSNNSITRAQWKAVTAILVAARRQSGWKGFRHRVMDHVAWAPNRKIDISTRYDMDEILARARREWREQESKGKAG